MHELQIFFSWFDKHSVAGVPLDIPAHFLVGACLYAVLVARRFSAKEAIIGVLGIAIFKELTFDLSSLMFTHNYFEPVKDVFFTALGPVTHAWFELKLRGPSAAESRSKALLRRAVRS